MNNFHRDDTRAEYIEGLRRFADVLESTPQLPVPHTGGPASPLLVMFLHSNDNRADLAEAARALPSKLTKSAIDSQFHVTGQFAGIHVQLLAKRDDVCERVVTGTREETVTEPDPEAVAALPQITKTVTVEDVTWICPPSLLAPSKETADA